MGIRVAVLGPMGYFHDSLNRMDFFLVGVGIVERIFFQGNLDEAIMIRVLRLLRLARLARLVRLSRHFSALWLILTGLYHALGTLLSVVPLLACICYFFALLANVAFKNSKTWIYTDTSPFIFTEHYFDTVGQSMTSIFQIVTLSRWSHIVRPLLEYYPFVVIYFVVLILLVSFGLLSTIVGSICLESVKTAEENDGLRRKKETDDCRQLMLAIGMCFDDADLDKSGGLDHEEVCDMLSKPRIREAWSCLGIPLDDVPKILRVIKVSISTEMGI